jgi:hypothetical protein
MRDVKGHAEIDDVGLIKPAFQSFFKDYESNKTPLVFSLRFSSASAD